MRAVTAAQMRAIDAAAVARDGEVDLMRQAGAAIARVVPRYRQDGPVIALAGNGNNGGDAFAALARLEGRRILYYDPSAGWGAARMHAFQRARASGVELRRYPVSAEDLRDAGLLLDGLLGVNARLPLDAATAERVRAMNDAQVPILALDIATGCDPTTGALGDPHVRAIATVALGRPKLGSFLDPGRDATGDLWCAPIGMHDGDARGIDLASYVLTADAFDALRPKRPNESEKRSAGAPLVIAGSEQFPGAAILCALGAARAGAGYVTVAAPAAAAAALRAHLIEQVVVTYDESDPKAAIATILDLSNHCNAIAIGPGLGLSDDMGEIVRGVMKATPLPMVADASALFHIGKHLPEFAEKPLVLTPHAGEFARLSGKGTVEPSERLPACARSLPSSASLRC